MARQKKSASTAVVKVKRTVGRPKSTDKIAELEAKLQFHMLQSAKRYIALIQLNAGITRLHKKIDRLRREAENREVLQKQVMASAQKIMGAAMRGEFKPGQPVRVIGPGAAEFMADMIAAETKRVHEELLGAGGRG